MTTANGSTVDLSTSVGGIRLDSCIYNASGPRSGTSSALNKIARSAGAGAVLCKSATLVAQSGNPQPRTHHAEYASFNSEGLPNKGIDYYIDEETIKETLEGCQTRTGNDSAKNNSRKPYIVSLSGLSLNDNIEMLRRVRAKVSSRDETSVDNIAAVELNLACPNVIGKPIIAYDVEQMDHILKQIRPHALALSSLNVPIGVKLAPYLDVQHFQAAAKVLNSHREIVKYVVTMNTLGNALCITSAAANMPVLGSNNGFAGMSGPAVKYTALANVKKLREFLDPSIDVVGVGGVSTGRDAFELLLCGAAAVQVATCHWKEGPGCFDRIADELADILMQEHSTGSVRDIINNLAPWSKEGAARAREAARSNKGATSVSSVKTSRKSSEVLVYQMISILLAVALAGVWGCCRVIPSP